MKGYLYKEFKQNRLFLFLSVVLALCVVFLPIIIVMTIEKTMAKEAFIAFAQDGTGIRIICALVGVIGMLLLETFTLKGDDKKLWAYFVVSNPKGITDFIFTKYGFILAMNVIYFAVCSLGDLMFTLIANSIGGISIPFMAGLYLECFFLQILLCALEIPFTIRFGDKKGSSIMSIFSIAIVWIFILLFFLNPVNVADIMNDFLSSGEIPPYMAWILPAAAVIGLPLSAFISTKLYMKGVEQYYK